MRILWFLTYYLILFDGFVFRILNNYIFEEILQNCYVYNNLKRFLTYRYITIRIQYLGAKNTIDIGLYKH